MPTDPILVTIPTDVFPLVQSVGGYTEGSPVSYQKQFEAALGVLLALWTSLSPLEQSAYRLMIQESDRTDPTNN